jgi:hypothetical protein
MAISSGASSEDDLTRRWDELLGSFSGVKVLHMSEEFVEEISRSLPSDDGEFHTELLPQAEGALVFSRA